jgi:hypothetical protein
VEFFSGGYEDFFDKLKTVITDIWSNIVAGFRSKISDISDYFTSGWTDEEMEKPARPTTPPAEETPRAEATPRTRTEPTPRNPTAADTGDTGRGAGTRGGTGTGTGRRAAVEEQEQEQPRAEPTADTSRNNERAIDLLNTRINTMNGHLSGIAANTKRAAEKLESMGNQFGR